MRNVALAVAAVAVLGVAVGQERRPSEPKPAPSKAELKKVADAAAVELSEAILKAATFQNPLSDDPWVPLTDPAEQEAALRKGVEESREAAASLSAATAHFRRAGNGEAYRKMVEAIKATQAATKAVVADLERRDEAAKRTALRAEEARLEADLAKVKAELERVRAKSAEGGPDTD